MDGIGWSTALAAGITVGSLAGLVPGFHTNTIAAILLALFPGVGPWGANALLAAASAHLFLSILPSTYIGVPSEETLSVLPAHRLLREGRGSEAVRIAANAALAATLAAVLLILPFKWLLREPGRLLEVFDATVPWVLVVVLLVLLLQERHKGWHAVGAALFCVAAAGGLGLLAGQVRLNALVPLPATPLLPLLSGLFGAAGLVQSAFGVPALVATQQTDRPSPGNRLASVIACIRGILAASWTAATPGLTCAVGASVAMVGTRQRDARKALACMNALGAAHHVFALALLWLALRARTGTAIAVQDLVNVQVWQSGRPPTEMLLAFATLVTAATAGHAIALVLDRFGSAWLLRCDARRLALIALGILVALVLTLSGVVGLLLLALAATVGLIPLALGVRRVHLTAALLVPALLARLTA